jgi:molybdenum cofactor cytidylyltransferase
VIAAILLAAGRATRFGDTREDTKLAAEWNGQPLIRYVAKAALASRASPIRLVTGHAAIAVLAAVSDLNLVFVHNDSFVEGLASSLRAGIASLPADARGAVILLADMPLVTGTIIDRLIASFETAGSETDAVVPVRNGRRGNPVLIGRRLFPDVAKLEGDRGAAALLKEAGRNIIECPVDDEAIEIDVDTRAALDALRLSSSS